jgi:hypothetical protein
LPGGALLAGPTTSCPYNPVSDHRHAPPYVQKSFLARQLLYSFRELHYLRQCNPVAPAAFIGSTFSVQESIFASKRCGALRKNKQ